MRMKRRFMGICGLLCLVSVYGEEKIAFWDSQVRRGANNMNEVPTQEWFQAAAALSIQWVRLAYDKWDTEAQDFLVGDTGNYQGLVPKDLQRLQEVLCWADAQGIRVVLTPLSLPGCRWRQHNNQRYDSRLWEAYRYQEMAIRFWVDLAQALQGYACIVAYNILNEPCPELGTAIQEQTAVGDAQRFSRWYGQYKHTPRDLYDFYNRIIAGIRKVDKKTPIMVESGFYAQPPSYAGWPGRLEDSKILYAVHMYEPYGFTANSNFRHGGIYSYPGPIPFGGTPIHWDKPTLIRYFAPFEDWIAVQGIPPNRIVVAEFGCMRRNPGVAAYLEDLVSLFEARAYHWAFYAFREDGWDGYDYELGTRGLPWAYLAGCGTR
ncbi:MAG: glycoside hydrolase family 5 protein [Treponema sp.]|nr:glycoside hydrolase family 5 protein [Treponema sp.]